MGTPLPRDPIADAQRNWERHGWGGDVAAPMAAITAIMRTQQILLARIETVLKPFGLTFARYELLALLSFARSGALPMNKASALLQVHPTSVTNAVDRLEKAAWWPVPRTQRTGARPSSNSPQRDAPSPKKRRRPSTPRFLASQASGPMTSITSSVYWAPSAGTPGTSRRNRTSTSFLCSGGSVSG